MIGEQQPPPDSPEQPIPLLDPKDMNIDEIVREIDRIDRETPSGTGMGDINARYLNLAQTLVTRYKVQEGHENEGVVFSDVIAWARQQAAQEALEAAKKKQK